MSSTFRNAPLEEMSCPQGWALTQREKGRLARVWLRAPQSAATQAAKDSSSAEELLRRYPGVKQIEIPPHLQPLPTGLDLQVHLRFPGQPQKETLEGGIESALYGGYDGVISMPNTNPFLDQPEILAEALRAAAPSRYPVRVGFAASATKGMQGQEPTDIAALARTGAVAITDDGWGVKSDDAQARIFAACAENDLLFQQHAEIPGHKGVAPKSPFQESQGLPEYPRTAESEMVRRDVELLRRFPGARYHILHISTRETLAEIRRAKDAGLAVTAEVSPHHLIFSNRDIPPPSDPRSTYFKMNPPLFDPEDRAALRAALRDGTIDCVSTDHAPHETELKAKGWLLAPFGTRGLETALPALLELHHQGELSLRRVEEVFSTAPRLILRHPEFARPSGLVFVDLAHPHQIGEDDLPGISGNSCFLGTELHGSIEIRAEADRLFFRRS
jgi:dihydroorotase